jgi:hypothetical protein
MFIKSSNIDKSLSLGSAVHVKNERPMSYYYVSMFCLVYSISRHGLSKDITDFVFEWETTSTKNSGQPTQFLGFGKDITPFAIKFYRPDVFTPFF